MVNTVFRPWVLALMGAVALYVAQLSSSSFNVVFVMMSIGLFPALLLHFAMGMLVLDCRAGDTPKSFLALPIIFYGAGLGAYAISWFYSLTLSQQIASMDVHRPIAYDPARQAVVTSDDNDVRYVLDGLQRYYRLDLAFVEARRGQTGFVALRTFPRAQCPQSNSRFQREFLSESVCRLRIPSRLDRTPVYIRTTTNDSEWGIHTVRFRKTEVQSATDKATATTGEIEAYPLIPIPTVGCDLSAAPRVECRMRLLTLSRVVGGSRGNRARVDAVATLLGLSPRA